MKHYSDKIVTALILDKGESIFEAFEKVAMEKELPAGFITGIGAVEDVIIGCFDKGKKSYIEKKLNGFHELLALNGNLSWKDEKPFIHLHAIMGCEDGSVVGGHLLQAKIAVTGEFFFHLFNGDLKREFVPEFGLYLMAHVVFQGLIRQATESASEAGLCHASWHYE